MFKEKRFYIKFSFGNWSVVDRSINKMIVAYSDKTDAETTTKGLNRLRNLENITKMINKLKTLDGYNYYLN